MIADFRKFKRKTRKRLLSKLLILGGLIFILVFLIIGNLRISWKRENLGIEMERLKRGMEKLSQEEGLLQSKISQSQTRDYLERVAREAFNLQKEGEKVVAFPLSEESSEEKTEESKNLWQKLLEKFKIK